MGRTYSPLDLWRSYKGLRPSLVWNAPLALSRCDGNNECNGKGQVCG
jgi:hypothetical protein